MDIVTYQSTSSIHWLSSLLDSDDVVILFWSKETSQRGLPASPRLRGRHHHQQEQQSESEQDEKEEEEEDGDNSARNDNSRFGGYDVSHIDVSQSSSTENGK